MNQRFWKAAALVLAGALALVIGQGLLPSVSAAPQPRMDAAP